VTPRDNEENSEKKKKSAQRYNFAKKRTNLQRKERRMRDE